MVTRCRLARPKFLSSKQVRLRQPALLYGTHSGVTYLSTSQALSLSLPLLNRRQWICERDSLSCSAISASNRDSYGTVFVNRYWVPFHRYNDAVSGTQ